MAKPGRTQKQIAERYKGNLGYYRRLHPWRRTRLIVSLLTIFGGLLAIFLFPRCGREVFFNAGKISTAHAKFANDCAKCHEGSVATGKYTEVLRDRFRNGVAIEAIDQKCEVCHQKHSFHEANVVQNRSCSACHQEHRGLTNLRLVASSECAACHNNSATMTASAQKGMRLPRDAFHRHPHSPQQIVLDLPRPQQGYTATFANFWEAHPEFQLKRENARDPDLLRFNHQRHFASDIPPVNGQKLDCNYCHQPQSDGRFMQRITYAANCQPCHSLQFDSRNPDIRIPHGNVDLVRTFLRSLPAQYADYARLKRGISEREVPAFVAQQIKSLRDQFHSGEELERAVFFTRDPYKPQQGMGAAARGNFTGCAFCHEVKPAANGTASVTKPILIDRWMLQANFNHAKHQIDPATQTQLNCDICHRARQSRETADVLMPAKASCISCHSPQGKVVADCITCHTYHAPLAAQ
jgi:predicted CXXCH cytochrome family protein